MKRVFLFALIYFLPLLSAAEEAIAKPYYENYPHLSAPAYLKESPHYYTFFQLFLAEAKMRGLEYAINNAADNGDMNGKMQDLNFHFKLGGKLVLGYFFDYDSWDLRAGGTIYYSSASDEARRSVQSESSYNDSFVSRGLVPVWYHPAAYNGVSYNRVRFSDAKADWDFDFYNAELELGKIFQVGEKVTLRPAFGLKSIFTYQNYKIKYSNGKTFWSNSFTSYKPENSAIHLKNRALAVGPKAGIETDWFIQKHIKLIFNAYGSLLRTFFIAARRETADYTSTDSSGPISTVTLNRENFNNRNSFKSYNPYAGIVIGIGWDKYFDRKGKTPLHVALDCTYFLDNYWKINQLVKFNDSYTDGTYSSDNTDLQMQGAGISFSLLF